MARIRRILHPSDFSKASGAAFAKAVELAKANGADLVLLHVLAPPLPLMAGDGYVSPQVYEDLDKSARAYASKRARQPRREGQEGRRSCQARYCAMASRTSRSSGRLARPWRT